MHKLKILIVIIIILLNITIPIYADDKLEEEITEKEMQEILETAVDIMCIPNINSRYAVIYDRSSRKYLIWKE